MGSVVWGDAEILSVMIGQLCGGYVVSDRLRVSQSVRWLPVHVERDRQLEMAE